VRNQDEAREFYTNKLGWTVRSDFSLPQMGNFRWLVVGPADQPDVSIALITIPGPPVMDDQTKQNLQDLMSKGLAGTVFLTTDDIEAAYKELSGRGIQFVDKPEQRPYGTDSSFRDPSGNTIRLTQPPNGA
jgi:predicted enzyme related to lactoylglutathione lyase